MPWPSGLPPAAVARVERQRASGLAGSLLSAPAAAALRTAGLAPVGEVMGCIVLQLGWYGYGCGWSGSYFAVGPGAAPVVVSGVPAPAGVGFGRYAAALGHGWDTALQRMLTEAGALGADGVVGVRLTEQPVQGAAREFMALGTAVRRVEPRPGLPMFLTELSGEDVAALAQAGWSPVAIAVGLSVAVRHDDWSTLNASASWSQWNGEVPGLSELLAASRSDARAQLAARAERLGGGELVVSALDTWVAEREIDNGHTDHVATTRIVGTTLRRSDPGAGNPRAAGNPRGAGDVALSDRLTVMSLAGPSLAASRRARTPYGGAR
jgi:uncharacterized protein YbjQ (UPF0145 family)